MSTPQRPGWYPAPDGSGTEQWWNGAAWSDTKRGIGGSALPGLPNYRPTPPAHPDTPVTLQQSLPYPTAEQIRLQRAGATTTNAGPAVGLVLGIAGILFFAPLGIVAIFLGARTLRRPGITASERTMGIGGIVTGIIALVWGAMQLAVFIFAMLATS
jgi:hypothetical protein